MSETYEVVSNVLRMWIRKYMKFTKVITTIPVISSRNVPELDSDISGLVRR